MQQCTGALGGKQDAIVHYDHQPLKTIFKKPLSSAPKRLQRTMLQLQPFNFTVGYKKGKYMYWADTLSRASLQKPTPFGPQEQVFQCCLEDNDELFRAELDSPETLPSTIEEIRVAKTAEPTLSALSEFVAQGWPPEKSCVSKALH